MSIAGFLASTGGGSVVADATTPTFGVPLTGARVEGVRLVERMSVLAVGLSPILIGKHSLPFGTPFGRSIPAHIVARASAAYADTSSRIAIGIHLVVRVPLRAMRLFRVHCATTAATGVHALRDGFQMSGVDARRGATNVVENHALGDGADKQLIGETVCADGLATDLELAVSEVGRGSSPPPTPVAVLRYLSPEALLCRLLWVTNGRGRGGQAGIGAAAPPHIDGGRDGFKVLGTNTSRFAAQVVQVHTGWDGANELGVCPSVGLPEAPVSEVAVAETVSGSSPQPAIIKHNFLPEPLERRGLWQGFNRTRAPEPQVMGETKQTTICPPMAALDRTHIRQRSGTPLMGILYHTVAKE